MYTYLISHFSNSANMQIIGLTATLSEHKVFLVNHAELEQQTKGTPTFRSNYIYLINDLNGKKFIVCQLYDQLKHHELYDWINQVILELI